MAYRQKHEEQGVCRSCKVKAKPGRKYCEKHLAEAAKRVRAGSQALRQRIEVLEAQMRSLQIALPRGIPVPTDPQPTPVSTSPQTKPPCEACRMQRDADFLIDAASHTCETPDRSNDHE